MRSTTHDEILLADTDDWPPRPTPRQARLLAIAARALELSEVVPNQRARERFLEIGNEAHRLAELSAPGFGAEVLPQDLALDAAFSAFSAAVDQALGRGRVEGNVVRRLLTALRNLRSAMSAAARGTKPHLALFRTRAALEKATDAVQRGISIQRHSLITEFGLDHGLIRTLTAAPAAPPSLFQF